MSQLSTMVCELCGEEAAETLVTRSRWEAFESSDQETRYFCASCAEEHGRRKRDLIAALEREDRRAAARDAAEDDDSFVRRLLESVLGR